jgi:hypothetical protein
MTKLSDAAFELMRKRKVSSIPSNELWDALREAEPKRTETTPNRKTPRTTAMRDLRKDSRFIVKAGVITLSKTSGV